MYQDASETKIMPIKLFEVSVDMIAGFVDIKSVFSHRSLPYHRTNIPLVLSQHGQLSGNQDRSANAN